MIEFENRVELIKYTMSSLNNVNSSTENQMSILVTMYNNTNSRHMNGSSLLASQQSFAMDNIHARSNIELDSIIVRLRRSC